MELNRLKGITAPTRARLVKAGLRSVEKLALVDLNTRRVPGIPHERLRDLRKRAQLTIFESAVGRVQALTRDAVHSLEETVSRATWATLDAAKVAQKRAQEAASASGRSARMLAKVAASKARDAARVAKSEYETIGRHLKRAPSSRRARLLKYEANARRAAEAAMAASAHAEQTLENLRESAAVQLKVVRKKSGSLLSRLREIRPGRFGGAS